MGLTYIYIERALSPACPNYQTHRYGTDICIQYIYIERALSVALVMGLKISFRSEHAPEMDATSHHKHYVQAATLMIAEKAAAMILSEFKQQ